MYGHIYIDFQLERYIWRDRVADVVFFLSFLFLPLHLVFTLSILEKFRYCLTLVINSIINCVWSGVQGKHLFIIVQILSMKLQEKWNKLYSFRPWWRKYGHIYLRWRLLNMAWCYYIWTEVDTILKEVSGISSKP